MIKTKPELLVPAGGMETLKTAVLYGADAVYMGGDAYGLRANAKNFSDEDLKKAVEFCHERNVKVYITANIYAHNYDLEGIKNYFKKLNDEIKPDAVLISDPGVFSLAKEYMKDVDLHISTQANTTNFMSVLFWVRQGAKRIVTARELSLKEIKEIRENIPDDIEIESFVHGAMCISYSGRCLLSNYFTGRDSNRGECTHPCRWKYTVNVKSQGNSEKDFESDINTDGILGILENDVSDSEGTFNNPTHKIDSYQEFYLEEDERPGEYLPVFENERGTYIMNSKDLCMIDHIPELVQAGINSFKIEGRMKNPLYVATVARTYRMAIDSYFRSEEEYRERLPWFNEQIASCTYRKFTTGFYFGKPGSDEQIYDNNTYVNAYTLIGIVEEIEDGRVRFYQKNKFSVGETIEIMKPDGRNIKTTVLSIKNEKNEEMESAPHPLQILYVSLDTIPEKYDILRRKES